MHWGLVAYILQVIFTELRPMNMFAILEVYLYSKNCFIYIQAVASNLGKGLKNLQ